jgi:hypothetical protein
MNQVSLYIMKLLNQISFSYLILQLFLIRYAEQFPSAVWTSYLVMAQLHITSGGFPLNHVVKHWKCHKK